MMNTIIPRISSRIVVFSNRALLSTRTEITAEQIEKGLEKVKKFKKFSRAPAGVPRIVGSGKELHEPTVATDMTVLSGVPSAQSSRTVLIAPRMMKTLQSGGRFLHQWQITWKNQKRWSNPLMGWTSSADPHSNLRLNFDSKEEAVEFAKRNGWAFETLGETPENTVEYGNNLYQHNFLPKRTELRVRKEGHKTAEYTNPKLGNSNFFMPLNYHGTGVVEQHGPSPTKK